MVLYVAILSTMLKGSFSRYPFIFSYVIVNFLSTVVQGSFKRSFGATSREYAMAYWTSDFVGTFLILMIIIHLIRRAMDGHKYRNSVYLGLLLGVAATGAISVLLMQHHSWALFLRKSMTEVGRDYYFSAVMLNAILWLTLVRNNHPDKQLYLLTSGLGLQLSGAAIAHALRMTQHMLFLANCFLITTYLLNLYVWYIALKRFPAVATAAAGAPAGSGGSLHQPVN